MILFIFITALGLLCVFEGVMPALAPKLWRKMMQELSNQSDRHLRIMGLVSMLTGLGLIFFARHFLHI